MTEPEALQITNFATVKATLGFSCRSYVAAVIVAAVVVVVIVLVLVRICLILR